MSERSPGGVVGGDELGQALGRGVAPRRHGAPQQLLQIRRRACAKSIKDIRAINDVKRRLRCKHMGGVGCRIHTSQPYVHSLGPVNGALSIQL